MQIKRCTKCNLDKSIDNFSPKHGKCKGCRKDEYNKNHSRVCWGCRETKPRSFFVGADRYCVSCHDLRDQKAKESKRKCSDTYRKEHPDKIKEKANKSFKRKYYGNIDQVLNYRLQACRKRAKEKSLQYDLDIEFLSNLYYKQNGQCAVTGIVFDFEFDESFSKRPFSPSVDRINSKLGYTKNNVRLVCGAVNFALSEYGDQVFDIICTARLQHKTREILNV